MPELKFQECKPLNGLPTSRCLGGMNSECLEGTQGPLCGLCEPEWYLANGACERCEEATATELGSGDVNASDEASSGGSDISGGRRLADGFKVKAYDPATHRVNYWRWVQWGFMMGGFVAALVLLLWKTTGDPLDEEAKKKRQQEKLNALKAKVLQRLPGKHSAGKEEGGEAAEGGKAAGTVLVPLIDCTGGVGLGLNKSNEVTEITPGGAAARSGLLRRGDRVVAVDGEALEGGRSLQEVLRPAASHVLEVLRREEVLRRAKKGGGEAAGGRGSRPAERGVRPPAPLMMQDQLPPSSPPPSPPPSSPPPYNPSDTPRLGQVRSSLRQLGVDELGSGASLGDLFGELKTGIGEKLKILITHFQIATSLKYTVNLSWPTD